MNKLALISSQCICKSNSILSSRLAKYFTQNGFVITKEVKEADLIVINTCGFREKELNYTKVILANVINNRSAASRIIAVGCLNKIKREVLENTFNGIVVLDNLFEFDSLIKAQKSFNTFKSSYFDNSLFTQIKCSKDHFSFKRRLSRLVNSIIIKGRQTPACFELIRKIIDQADYSRKFFVQIGTGCIGNCSYCVIKKARGDVVSRPISDILSDIKEGYKEGMVLNLVADDCGSYGVDRQDNIFNLLQKINEEFPKISIDFCYLNPSWLEKYPKEYLEMFKKFNINSINITLQSGSDRIIKLMNRNYKIENILRVINKIKQISPSTMLWSHFIVDFPSETWQDFLLTLKSTKPFHFYFCFIYSSPTVSGKNKKLTDIIRQTLKAMIMELLVLKRIILTIVS